MWPTSIYKSVARCIRPLTRMHAIEYARGHLYVLVCVCVLVREKERSRDIVREGERERGAG